MVSTFQGSEFALRVLGDAPGLSDNFTLAMYLIIDSSPK
jgi:hypothetical protein